MSIPIEFDSIIESCAQTAKVDESVKAAYKDTFWNKKAVMTRFVDEMKEDMNAMCCSVPYIGDPNKNMKNIPEAIKEGLVKKDKIAMKFLDTFLTILDSSCNSSDSPW